MAGWTLKDIHNLILNCKNCSKKTSNWLKFSQKVCHSKHRAQEIHSHLLLYYSRTFLVVLFHVIVSKLVELLLQVLSQKNLF